MKIQQLRYAADIWERSFTTPGFDSHHVQLVLVFGAPSLITTTTLFEYIQKSFPTAQIASCSTAGEIAGGEVFDDTVVATAIQFEKTNIKCCVTDVRKHADSFQTGSHLQKQLQGKDLQMIFVLSDGMQINGSDLVAGLNENNVRKVAIVGGLAADGERFQRTFVGLNQVPEEGTVVAIGFYGLHLKTGHGSFGGWDEFGPERTITHSEKNILYTIDDKNALDLYKEYLGPYQNELPGSALLFPLSLREPGRKEYVVRTILGINEEHKSLQFAGNLPKGSKVRLMKANFDRLVDGSRMAAKKSMVALSDHHPQLAILISCVGRKIILKDRIEDEVEAVRKIFPGNPVVSGFYSYGELSPLKAFSNCELHNQTMTITTFSED